MIRNLTLHPPAGAVLARAATVAASVSLAVGLSGCSFSIGETEPVGEEQGSSAAEEGYDIDEGNGEASADDAAAEDGAEEAADGEDPGDGLPMDASEAQTWPSDSYWLQGTGEGLYRLEWTPTDDTTVQMTHSGSSNFIINSYGEDETRYASLVNEIGVYEGSARFGDLPMLDGSEAVAYLHVQADGPWTIGR
ncbi:hypothetical protein O4J56_13145 [Nocardiopsis sp. RSe5-2]|uniref:Lipoprotein n=1 Tax=Nocardiopsis endophytica TaxID=3018445 RepID=A0ABT4U4E7_9ACTN|nr:hypothetical protein [Nocardiopsis endophytica]MDA2811581.1 hypothetical protein [Nocardiopsis endophytica]